MSTFLSALVKDKESWQKEREEMLSTLRSSHNEAKSVSVFANQKLKDAQDILAQAKLIRSGADRDLVQAMKLVHYLQGKLKVAHDQFRALYVAVAPIIASVCR